MKYFIFVFIFLLLGSFATAKDSKPTVQKTIHWLFYDVEGAVNLSDERLRSGYIMEIFQLIKAKMPGYTHQVVEVPFFRGLQQMKKKKSVCSFLFLKNPERDRFMVFGSPYISGMPAGVITTRENKKILKYVSNGKMIDIDKLLLDRDIQFGSTAERFYGLKINNSLAEHKTANILYKQGANVDREFKNLLNLGRIDAYFGYPFEADGNEKAQFFFVKGNTEILEPRIGCEKSAFGEEVIAKTEEVRAAHKLDKEFTTIFERFFPKSMQEEFLKMSKGK